MVFEGFKIFLKLFIINLMDDLDTNLDQSFQTPPEEEKARKDTTSGISVSHLVF